MAKKITVKLLRELDACDSQVRKFKRLFPDGATVTKANCLRAARAGLDVDWLATSMLLGYQYREYDRIADAAYNKGDGACEAEAIAFWKAVTGKGPQDA